MTLVPSGFIRIGTADLEYRMIGPQPLEAPTIVMLHEGLGSAALWGDFPDRLQAATGAGVFVYSRAGYGASSPVPLPRPLDYMRVEALEVLPKLLATIGFRRGVLLGHSDGASIAAIYAGGIQDHRVRAVALIAPHFVVEDISVASIAEIKTAYETTDLRAKLAPGSIRNSATGISRNTLPSSACRSRSSRVRTMSMAPCARSRSRERSATVPST